MKGDNNGIYNYSVLIDIQCAVGKEIETTGEYRKAENTFFFLVKSKYGCAEELGRLWIILHQYRVLFMLVIMAMGVFCNFWGMKYLAITLRLIGFMMSFLFSFFILNVILYESRLISPAPL